MVFFGEPLGTPEVGASSWEVLRRPPQVTGDANDYVGKGMNGGRVVAVAPAESPFKSEVEINWLCTDSANQGSILA